MFRIRDRPSALIIRGILENISIAIDGDSSDEIFKKYVDGKYKKDRFAVY